ncbi:MAG: extracellular solute-binding protein [Bradymonadales bacterium]|nr:MAG: extracellular solute-binding protein [Bradymonadales bacterium]
MLTKHRTDDFQFLGGPYMFRTISILFAAALFFSCTSQEGSNRSSSAENTDRLVILSPHRKSIQEEFVPRFRDYYRQETGRDIRVDWLDQGGTSAGLRFLRARYARNSESAEVDIFWGGGASAFIELDQAGFLEAFPVSDEIRSQIPDSLAGVAMRNEAQTWHATAISGFGIFYNKRALGMRNLEAPRTWDELGHPRFYNQLSLTDPRQSGSASIMNMIVLESMGWERGWEVLTAIAGNTNHFTHSSSDPIRAVVTGDVLAAMAIDFYAAAQIADVGAENLGFALPEGQSILDPDPIAILRGAPNRLVAEKFVEFVMLPSEQKLLMLPRAEADGPRRSTLGRMGVNRLAYEQTEGRRVIDLNPFSQESSLQLDMERFARTQRVLNDLIGAIFIDTHSDLKSEWGRLIQMNGDEASSERMRAFSKPPLTETEFLELADQWGDDRLRNRTINQWVDFARNKYRRSQL